MSAGRRIRSLGVFAGTAVLFLALWSCQGSPGRIEPVSVDEIAAHIRNLSSDQMEGRAVGTPGIEMAARYHEDYFRTMGLEPAFGTSYRQTFPLKGSKPDPQASLEISGPAVALAPALWDEFVIRTEREDAPAEASGELVYCGYLIQAPERSWDDIKGLDLTGKVLLVEINEPGNRPGGVFDGEDMTYYGRWSYKFEKATELGAAGVLIIHETKGAAYGWDVLRASWGNESFFLPDRHPRLLFEGWLGGETADRVLAAAKLDRKALRAAAETPDFAPVPLGLKATVRQHRDFHTVEGVNVAGIIRAKHPAAKGRTIVLSAHYDHFGKDETLVGDQIYNGAVDNCSASAALLATAGYYAQRPEKLKDDLCFVAVTAEEQLLLGSDYFARHLPPLVKTVVADINFEMTNVWGETEDVFAVGGLQSDLDGVCREAAETARPPLHPRAQPRARVLLPVRPAELRPGRHPRRLAEPGRRVQGAGQGPHPEEIRRLPGHEVPQGHGRDPARLGPARSAPDHRLGPGDHRPPPGAGRAAAVHAAERVQTRELRVGFFHPV